VRAEQTSINSCGGGKSKLIPIPIFNAFMLMPGSEGEDGRPSGAKGLKLIPAPEVNVCT